jgi:hypothetical protein
MNRTDFFKQIGLFAAGAATAIATKLSVAPKDQMKVTDSVTLRSPNGETYNLVVVPQRNDVMTDGKVKHVTLHINSPEMEVRDLNV